MRYGRVDSTGEITDAAQADPRRTYVCPRPGCGGRLYLPNVSVQEPHFRHRPGEGTVACDEYVPGSGGLDDTIVREAVGVEDDPNELGLLLVSVEGRWGLGLRLPEIPADELGNTSLRELRHANVEVSIGGTFVSRISALELRSGVGAARIPIHPAIQDYHVRAAGDWPRTISKERWQLDTTGLHANGTLFRVRHGEWTRLLCGTGVHHGEHLVILADDRFSPPAPVVTATCTPFSAGNGLRWTVWEIRLPEAPVDSGVSVWLDRLGHSFVPRPWSVELATPPRARDEHGNPVFWVGDKPVVSLMAPRGGVGASVSSRTGTVSLSASVTVAQDGQSFVVVQSLDERITHLAVAADRSARIDITFVKRTPCVVLLEMLTKTPRIRAWIGDVSIEAWRDSGRSVLVSRPLPEVRVDLGAESSRARVTVWERGKQRSIRCLDARNVARVIEAALPTASHIEVDAGNAGRLSFALKRATTTSRVTSARERLDWHDHIVSLGLAAKQRTMQSILQQPHSPTSLAVRPVGAAALVRGRLALRRRFAAGGGR